MDSEFFKKLWEYNDILSKENKRRGWMCIYECFIGYFKETLLPPFDSNLQCYFPVLEGTPHATKHLLTPQLVQMLGILSQIPEKGENDYEEKLDHMLNLPLTKEMFKEHSLFLLKEHCKIFSEYSEKAKELLIKLESLE